MTAFVVVVIVGFVDVVVDVLAVNVFVVVVVDDVIFMVVIIIIIISTITTASMEN